MNVLSLFSGIGGLDLGLERAGMTIRGQVEIDPWCRKVLAQHWPEVPRHDDVRTCAEWWGDRAAPDLVCGGFPCQPVSRAGKRQAQADERWLWPGMADTVRRLRPRFVLVENPPGLLDPVAIKDDEDRIIGYTRPPVEDVLGDLATLGYDTDWDCVSAEAVGAPHLRERIWIVAHAARLRDGRSRQRAVDGGPRGGRAQRLGTVRPETVADPEGQCGELRTATGERPGRSASSRPALADASSERCGQGPRIFGGMGPARCGWWAAEPDVGRVAHGVPARVDRLRGLGNAVVPQVAEHIGRLIMAAAA
jgi:DNA (cytosine-5)-methyltransferase 1